jgi:hypothetical protein
MLPRTLTAAAKLITHVLRILLLLFMLSFFEAAAQNTFYVSSQGNDSNNGLSPSAPRKTIPYLQPGKTYLLNRGDTLYFSIGATSNPNASGKIRVASYGSGNKPVLSLYKKIRPSAWVKHSGNVWKVNISSGADFTGLKSTNSNVGFLKVGGRIYGNKLSALNALSGAWDFYSDDTYLYVFNGQNPSQSQVQASCNVSGIELSDNMEVSDISICGSGAHGISAHERSNVTLSGIDISETGGSFLPGYGNGTTRYGNGIEFYNNAKNCLVQQCSVRQAYDVAFTMQGTGLFSNVIFQNNTADHNEQSFETWLGSGSAGFRSCKFINNQCYNAGFGWSHDVRPVKYEGVHILTYLWEVNDKKAQDLLIEGNTFNRARSGLWYWGVWDPIPPAVSRKNIVTLDASVPIRSLIPAFTIKNSKDFVFVTGLESETVFNTIKSDQTLAFAPISDKTFGALPFTLQATASSGLPVTFVLKSGPAWIGPALLLGQVLTLTGTGTVTVEASQNGNDSYNPAPAVTRSFTVSILGGAPAPSTPAAGAPAPQGGLLWEQWVNIPGIDISSIPLASPPSASRQLPSFESPSNISDNYGSRVRGYITAPQSGTYTFWVAGDDKAELWLSTNEYASNKVKIAYTNGWTFEREYTKSPSQKSTGIVLSAGKKYYVEALQKEGPGGDHLSVQWQLADGTVQTPISGNYLTPYTTAVPPAAPGTILLEQWMNAPGNSIADIPLQKTPSKVSNLSSFEAPSNFADQYGSRISGYILPAQSGRYTFWIASDDVGELWLSKDENPAGKVRIAYNNSWTNVREFSRFASQKSVSILLEAGKKYYVEALQKEGPGGDHLAVQWQLPDGSIQTPVPGKYLLPYSSQLRTALRTDLKGDKAEELSPEADDQTLSVFPNPTSDQATIVLTPPLEGQIQVLIYNTAGQLVSKVYDGFLKAGARTLIPLKAGSLANGTYLIHVVGSGLTSTTKVLIIR